MKVRYQADADLNQKILLAVARLEPAIDFQTAQAGELEGLPDSQVLQLTADAGRILVTHDRKTMPRHFADFVTQRDCPGVLIVPQKVPIAQAAEELVLIWSASEAAAWVNRICPIPL